MDADTAHHILGGVGRRAPGRAAHPAVARIRQQMSGRLRRDRGQFDSGLESMWVTVSANPDQQIQ